MESKKYKVGMYGGKFMPFHKGHLYCVEEASKQCETLYVLLFHGGDQEIEILKDKEMAKWLSPEEREKAIKKACSKLDNVIVESVDITYCKNLDGSEDWEAETPLVLNVCGHLDAVYGSELSYAEYFSKAYPDAEYVMIDVQRKIVPISGTMIRAMNEEERKKWVI